MSPCPPEEAGLYTSVIKGKLYDVPKYLCPAPISKTLRAKMERYAAGAFAALEADAEGGAAEAEGILTAWAREMEELGIEVKGPWLVDFDSGDGCWCWRWPEESLGYWHGYDEGFAGRVRIQ